MHFTTTDFDGICTFKRVPNNYPADIAVKMKNCPIELKADLPIPVAKFLNCLFIVDKIGEIT